MPTGLLLSDDLIFTSRIVGTARDLGCAMQAARSVETLEALVRQMPVSCIILDLANPGLVVSDLLQRLRDSGTLPRVVAYGPHVDAATLRAAREAGCDPVLPRSKFVEELPHRLAEWLAGPASQG
jgi:CheY-like chemotaxis protein